jgi:hypothetical protein
MATQEITPPTISGSRNKSNAVIAAKNGRYQLGTNIGTPAGPVPRDPTGLKMSNRFTKLIPTNATSGPRKNTVHGARWDHD